MWPRGDIYGQMYQGGDAVSKTVCGGFDSQLSVPEAGSLPDDVRVRRTPHRE